MSIGTDYTAGLTTVRALIAARKSNKVKETDGSTRDGISLDDQDDYSREFTERMGWTVAGAAKDTISGRVAPIDRKKLGAWLREPSKFDVIVAYKSDRYSRGEDTDWSRIESWAADNGKTLVMIDSGTGIRYPARDDSDYWQWSAAKRQAGREWNDIRDRSMRTQKSIRANGGLAAGAIPFGYQVTGSKYGKTLSPTAAGLSYVPLIFQRVAAGESLHAVADWLMAEGVRPCGRSSKHKSAKFWPTTISKIIRNPAYYGRKSNGDGMTIDIPALVDVALFTRANDKLSRKPKSGQRSAPQGKALLTSVLFCPVCGDSPMYRIQPVNVRKDGTKVTTSYYRCSGKTGPEGVSCGLMLRLEAADALAVKALAKLTVKVVKSEQLPATDREAEIAKLRQERKQLDDLSADYDTRYAALTADIKRLTALPAPESTVQTVEESYSYADMAADGESLGDRLRADRVRMFASKDHAAIQHFTDAATAALATGTAGTRYALETDGKLWLAVEYATA